MARYEDFDGDRTVAGAQGAAESRPGRSDRSLRAGANRASGIIWFVAIWSCVHSVPNYLFASQSGLPGLRCLLAPARGLTKWLGAAEQLYKLGNFSPLQA